MKFGKVLTELKKEKGMTNVQLAKIFKVGEATIRGWQQNNRQPSYETLCQIADFFGVTVGQMLGVEEY